MGCYSPLQGYKDPENGGLIFKRPSIGPPQVLEVACGQCLGCRLDRTRMWAIRIVQQSSLSDAQYGNSWVTLTYRDRSECTPEQLERGHYLPADGSLNKKHFRDFAKRLRKFVFAKNGQGRVPIYEEVDGQSQLVNGVSYYHCGEYGEENFRPHYHACLFNVSFEDQKLYYDEEGVRVYESESLKKLWPFGFSTVAPLTYDNAAYTAGYVQKKITGKKAQDHYLRCDDYGVAYWLEPEYATMSLRPAIGKKWYEKFKRDVFPEDQSPVPGVGIVRKVPRYYDTLLEREDTETFELVKELRRKFVQEHADDFTPARLRDKYKVAQAKQALKRRRL